MENRIIKLTFLVIAIIYTYSNTFKAIKGQEVTSRQILLMAIGIVGFVAIQFGI